MSQPDAPTGTVAVALQHAAKLLERDPADAKLQAEEILKAVPGHPLATLLLALSQRALGNESAALALLEQLVVQKPAWAPAHFELGRALAASGIGERAVEAMLRAVALRPEFQEAWLALADHLTAMGDTAAADAA